MILANTRSTWQPLLNKVGIDGKITAEHQRWENLVSGSTARGAVGYIMMPITVVKVRYEVCTSFFFHMTFFSETIFLTHKKKKSNFYNYTSLNQAFTSIIKTDGIRGIIIYFFWFSFRINSKCNE